jgi:hypothetical protein
MNAEQFKEVIEARLAECTKILLQRNTVYSDNENFFSNFKSSALLLSILGFQHWGKPLTPEDVTLIYEVFKVQRWDNAIRIGITHEDNWTDGINYMLIGEGCHKDGGGL